MNVRCTLACLLLGTACLPASAELTLSPEDGITHYGRVGSEIVPRFHTYTLTNNGSEGTDYLLEWDPNELPNSPIYVNYESSGFIPGYLEPGQSVDFEVQIFNASSPVQGVQTLRIATNNPPTEFNRTHTFDILERPDVTISGNHPLETLPYRQNGAWGTWDFTVTNNHGGPVTIDMEHGNDTHVFPDRVYLAGFESTTVTMTTDPYSFDEIGRYSISFAAIEVDNNHYCGGGGVAFDYARYPVAEQNLDMVDAGTLTSTIEIEDALCLSDDPFLPWHSELAVELNLAHPNVGELYVTLESPIGQQITLINLSESGTSLNRVYGFDSAYGPGDMRDLLGTFAKGTWTLRVSDIFPGSTGVLESWALRLPTGNDCAPRPEDLELEATVGEVLTFDLPILATGPTVITLASLPTEGFLVDPVNGPVFSLGFETSGTTLQYISNNPGFTYFDYQVTRPDGSDPSYGFVAITISEPCPRGDLNDDGNVDLNDLATVLAHFGSSNQAGDVDGDGSVTLNDLAEVLAQFGQSC